MSGQQVSERTIEEVSAEIQRIDPPAIPEIERVRVTDDLEVIAVRVNQGSARPYQYRGTAYRRVGNTTVRTWMWPRSATLWPRPCESAG